MADKYLNLTTIQVIKTWAKSLFALDADLNAIDAKVDEIIAKGGEPNVIETVKVNGTAQTITNKAVDISVPTKTSDINNDSNFQTSTEVETAIETALANGSDPYQTKSEVEAEIASQIGGAYKPQGTIPFADLPAPSASIEHYVYDISDAFVTTTDFKEGAGHSHPAGTNVACIEVSTGVFKWDCMAGFIDTSTFWSNVEGQTNSLTAATVAEIQAILDA